MGDNEGSAEKAKGATVEKSVKDENKPDKENKPGNDKMANTGKITDNQVDKSPPSNKSPSGNKASETPADEELEKQKEKNPKEQTKGDVRQRWRKASSAAILNLTNRYDKKIQRSNDLPKDNKTKVLPPLSDIDNIKSRFVGNKDAKFVHQKIQEDTQKAVHTVGHLKNRFDK